MCSEAGVAVVVHPHDEWFAEVTAADVPTLMTGMFGAGADETAVTGPTTAGRTARRPS